MKNITSKNPGLESLTCYPIGSLSELAQLFFPLLLSVFSGSLMIFFDRLFLSRYSLVALESVTAANYLCMLFQLGCCRITATSQVLVSRSLGEGNRGFSGRYSWQMIWFSLISMLLTYPLSLVVGSTFWGESKVALHGKEYFSVLMIANFLFPLGSALSAFFIGLGKTRIVGTVTAIAQLLNILLNYLLIFGFKNMIPCLGVKGAAFATVISQGVLCIALFSFFLLVDEGYGTRVIKFQKKLIREGISLGLPKSLSKISVLIAWNAAVSIITKSGGDYLLVLSVGASCWLLFSPISQTLEQVLTTQVSFLFGKERLSKVLKCIKSALIANIFSFLCIGLILYLFIDPFLEFFLKEPISADSYKILKQSFFWLWIFLFLEGISNIALGFVTGLSETLFTLKMNLLINWPTIYLPFLLAFRVFDLSPDKVWALSSICMFVAGTLCFIKGFQVVRSQKTLNSDLIYES